MSEEAERVIRVLHDVVGAKFRLVDHTNQPFRRGAVWVVQCSDIDRLVDTAFANAVWKDSSGNVWIESVLLGDTTRWVEHEYGERGAVKSMSIDLTDFAEPSVRAAFGERFPLVIKRLKAYEKLAADVSERHHLRIAVKYEGGNDIATFRLATKVEPTGAASQESERITVAVLALKEAFEEIEKLEQQSAGKSTGQGKLSFNH